MENQNDVFLTVYPKGHPLPPDERLRACAAEYAAKMGLCFDPKSPLRRTERGKPYFEGAALSFSVTHSGSYWICAFWTAPLGIDLQDDRPCKKESIARRFFHPLEQAFLAENNWEPFFSVWAAKESYVKFTGEGISDRFSRFSVVDEAGNICGVGSAGIRPVPFQEGYALCVCGENLGEIRVIFP